MTQRRDLCCLGLIVVAALAILPKQLLGTPIRWDFIHAYGADVFLLFRIETITGHWEKYALLLVFWFSGWGAGRLLLRRLIPQVEWLHSWAVSTLIGWGLLSHGLFMLAALKRFHFAEIACLLGVGCVAGVWEYFTGKMPVPPILLRIVDCGLRIAGRGEECAELSTPPYPPQSWGGRFWKTLGDLLLRTPSAVVLSVVCIALLAGSFFSSLLPPTQSDALRYHLTTPKIWLEEGGFLRIPHLSFSNFPMTIDILYAIPLAFELPSVAKMIHWSMLVACLGLIYRIAVLGGGRVAGGLAMAFFASIPFVPILASWAFNEMGLCAYLLLAVAAGIHLVNTQTFSWRSALLYGMAGGWLLGCKYTALIFLFSLSLLLMIPQFSGLWNWRRCKGVIVGSVIAFLVASPWYIKNVFYHGNPVYPMGIGVFGEGEWSAANAAFFSFHAGLKGDLNAAGFLSFPEKIVNTLGLIIKPLWSPIDIGKNNFGDWPVSALYLIGLPGLFFFGPEATAKRLLAVFGGVLFVIWAWTYRDARFLLPCLSVLAIPLAVCTAGLWQRQVVFRWLVVFVVAYYGLWNAGKFCDRNGFSPWRVVGGIVDEERYLRLINQTTRTFYHGFEAVAQFVPPDEKILIHGQHYNFHCLRRYLGADWFDTPPLIGIARETGTVQGIVNALRKQGIGYVLYDKKTIQDYNQSMEFPAYWLLCLPARQTVEFLGRLRDLEPLRMRDAAARWEQVRVWHESVRTAIEADPGWQNLEAFWQSSVLEIVYNKDGMILA
ncbi:MAG TPA: hypothetical protein PLG59_06495, partial [bacterium]|nr:hypothetical protein [bacterium]